MAKAQKKLQLRRFKGSFFVKGYKLPTILFALVIIALGLLYRHQAASSQAASTDRLSLVSAGQKICQLTGEYDRQFRPQQLTLNQTASRFGLAGTDNGSSFMFHDKLWFLFGDSVPTKTFMNRPNEGAKSGRNSNYNDSLAYTTDTNPSDCLQLQFITGNSGAFASPIVSTGTNQKPVSLRTNEVPEAGIADAGKAYVVFSTDNTASNPVNGPSHPAGGGNRTVVATTSAMETGHFRYLYDLSTGKFTYVSLADGNDGYIYIWGTAAAGSSFRHSPPYLARKPVGGMGQAANIQYWSTTASNGQPIFTDKETSAAPLFHDQPSDCIGELSVQWNIYLNRWLMLYNCADSTKNNPRGIYARVATTPWGPWSRPLTIFAVQDGLCQFIHTAGRTCDNLSDAHRASTQGGAYSPYILQPDTVGSAGAAQTTIYYTLSTWNPYQVILMSSTLGIGRH